MIGPESVVNLSVAVINALFIPAVVWPWPYYSLTMRIACTIQRWGLDATSDECERVKYP
jgi:hypothetical protein